MTEPKLDLTPLDPSRDAAAWERRIRAVAARAAAGAARRRPGEFTLQLAAWARPGLALAAAAAIAVWVPAWLRPAGGAPASGPASVSARLAAWAASDDDAAASALLLALGDDDDAR